MLKKVLLPALGGAILLVVFVYGCRYIDWTRKRLPAELVQTALTGATPDERQLAAAELTEYGSQVLPELRQVFAQSDMPAVRAICLHGLGNVYDYDSLELFFAALDDESPLVRARAAAVLERLLGRRFGFNAHAGEAERRRTVDRMRQEWNGIKDSGLIDQFKERMLQREKDRR